MAKKSKGKSKDKARASKKLERLIDELKKLKVEIRTLVKLNSDLASTISKILPARSAKPAAKKKRQASPSKPAITARKRPTLVKLPDTASSPHARSSG